MSDTLISFTMIIVDTALWYFITRMFLSPRFKSQYHIIPCVAIIAINMPLVLLHIDLHSPILNSVLMYGSFVACSLFLYKNRFWLILLADVAFWILGAIFESVTLLVLLSLFGLPLEGIQSNAVITVLIFSISRFIEFTMLLAFLSKFGKKQFLVDRSFRIELVIFLALYITLLVISLTFYYNNSFLNNRDNFFLVLLVFLFLLAIATFILFFRIIAESRNLLENTTKIKKLEMELALNNQIELAEKSLRTLRHNINNTFTIIQGLVRSKDYEELDQYLVGIYKDITMANDIVILENKPLAALLNAKKIIAKENGINFQTVINTSSMWLPLNDMCSLIGNLLDNAIEAAGKAEDMRYIRLRIQANDSCYLIECENNYKEEPLVQNGFFVSKKTGPGRHPGNEHGIGTRNIREIVEKQNGFIKNTFENGIFYFRASFPKTTGEDSP